MVIKSFTAPTIAAALKQIREEMGGDAIVLNTRVCPYEESILTGHKAEVTACIDERFIKRAGKPAKKVPVNKTSSKGTTAEHLHHRLPVNTVIDEIGESDIDSQFVKADIRESSNNDTMTETAVENHPGKALTERLGGQLRSLYKNLLNSDVPEETALRLYNKIENEADQEENINITAFKTLYDELVDLTKVDIKIGPGSRIVFVGPSGSGKTSVMGKVAVQLSAGFKQKIKLLSLNHIKGSASEKVGTDGDIRNLPIEEIKGEYLSEQNDCILLIDTPPIERDENNLRELIGKIKSLKPNIVFFVFSACSRTNDLIDSINYFESLTPTYLIASHLDETDRWGGVLAMTEYLNIPLAFVTDSPGGLGRLNAPDPAVLARQILMPEGSINDQ